MTFPSKVRFQTAKERSSKIISHTSRFFSMITALGQWKCWLAMLPTPKLDARGVRAEGIEAPARILELGLSVAELVLNVSCIECTGPDMPLLSDLLNQARAIDDATNVANQILRYVTDLLEGEFVQVTLDRLVSDSKVQCPFSPEFDANAAVPVYERFDAARRTDSIDFLVALGITVLSLFAGLSIIALAMRVFVRLRHRRWLKSLSRENLTVLSTNQNEHDEATSQINSSSDSLFRSDAIPAAVRYAIPVVILGNIAFFLSGHLSLGGSVTIMLTLAGEPYVADNFFDFSMASSAVEIWNGTFVDQTCLAVLRTLTSFLTALVAGGKELAMMILIFSGIWPYTKQLISLVVWFLPPSIVSVTTRESIYLWLDCLGKWSIIDIFVLVMTLAAFRVSVQR